MQFQIGCPGCQSVLAIEAEPGQQVQCPACGTLMLLTAPPPPAAPEPPPRTYLDDLQSAFADAPPPPPATRRPSTPAAKAPAPPAKPGKSDPPGKAAAGKPGAPAAKPGAAPGKAAADAPGKSAGKSGEAKGNPGEAPKEGEEGAEGEAEEDLIYGFKKKHVIWAASGAGAFVVLVTTLLIVFSKGKQPPPDENPPVAKAKTETPAGPATKTDTPEPGEYSVWLPTGVKVLGPHRIAHGEAVNGVALSGDGKRMITAGWDRIVRLWDTESSRLIRRLGGHTDTVWAVAFSNDGLLAASAGSDKEIRIWDVTGGKLLHALPAPDGEPVRALAFSPDSKSLAAAGDCKYIQLYDAAAGTPGKAFRGHGDSILALAFSPDGNWIASACRDKVVRAIPIDAKAGSQVGEIPWHTAPPTSVAFSPNSELLASVDESQTVIVTHLAKKIRKAGFGTGSTVFGPASVVFSPDGENVIVGGSDGEIRIIDYGKGNARSSLSGHTGPVPSLSLTKDGLLASASADRTVRLWNLSAGRERQKSVPGSGGYVYSVAFSPDGNSLAVGGDDRLLRIWSAHDTAAAPTQFDLTHAKGIHSVAWTKDSKRLATAAFDNKIVVWQVGQSTPLRLMSGHAAEVLSVSWAPDGKRLVSGSQDRTVRVWDTTDGKLVKEPLSDHTAPVNAVAWSPDGKWILSASDDGVVKIRKSDLSADPVELPPHTGPVRTAAFSADSRYIATGGDDSTVRICTIGGVEVLVFQAVRGPVRAVAFRADGKAIAAATGWGEVAVHDPADGGLLHWFQFPTPIEALSYTPDGKTLATANGNTSVYLLDVSRPGNPLLALSDAEGEENSIWTGPLRDAAKPADFRTAATGVSKLGRKIPPGDLTLLIQRLGDPDPTIRGSATAALTAAGPPALPLLVTAFKGAGSDTAKRTAIVTAIGGMGADARFAAALLNGALKDPSVEVRAAAAAAVGKLGPASVETLLGLLDSKDDSVRKAAEAGLADPQSIPPLVKMLEPTADKKIRLAALAALAKVGPKCEKEAKPAVLDMLLEKDVGIRGAAAAALGFVDSGNPDAVGALSLALSVPEEDRAVRLAAVRSLGRLGAPARDSAAALLGAFDPASKDPIAKDADFQVAAAEALSKVGEIEAGAAPILVAALDDKRVPVRKWLVEALANMKNNALAVIEPLEKRGDAEMDPDLRQAIQVVVAKLKNASSN